MTLLVIFMGALVMFRIQTIQTLQAAVEAKLQPLWRFNFKDEVTELVLIPNGSGVLVTTRRLTDKGVANSSLWFIDAHGVIRWRYAAKKDGVSIGAAVSADGSYIALVETELGKPGTDEVLAQWVIILDRDSRELWRHQVWVDHLWIGERGERIAAVGEGSIVFFSGSGQILWETEFAVNQEIVYSLLSKDGRRLLIIRDDGLLRIYDDSGAIQWQHWEKYAGGEYIGEYALAASHDLRYVAASAQPYGTELRFFDTVEGKSWSVRLTQSSGRSEEELRLPREFMRGLAVDGEGKAILSVTRTEGGVRLYRFTREGELLFRQEVPGKFHLLGVWMQEEGMWGAVALRSIGSDCRVQLILINARGEEAKITDLPDASEIRMTPKLDYVAGYDAKGNVFLNKLLIEGR